ncbi:MAG TPA: hypothetical protein VF880_03595 [Actinomycetes bacterium]
MTEYPTDQGGETSTTEQVKEQVAEKAQVAQDKASQATQQAKGRFRDQVDQRSTQAGQRLAGGAADARSVAEELRRQGKDTPARLVEQAAGQADRAAAYLKTASGERILRDEEDFARSKPWAVAAGGLVVGFAASRFLKASSSRRYQQARAGYPDTVRTSTTAYPSTTYPSDAQAPVTTYPEAADTTTTYPAGVPVVGTYDPVEPDERLPRAE